jgi:hypothetical protein
MPRRRPSLTASVVAGRAATLTLAACAPASTARPRPAPRVAPRVAAFPLGGVGTATAVAPGVGHEQFVVAADSAHGPWAVHVLRVAPGCVPVALKAGRAAVGRATTSALVAEAGAVAGVNADFFSFTPPGVPVTAHVSRGVVVAGPSRRPVLAWAARPGTPPRHDPPFIGVLTTTGALYVGGDSLGIAAWNRGVRDGLAVFTAGWGARTDSVPGRVFVTLRRPGPPAWTPRGREPRPPRTLRSTSCGWTPGPRPASPARWSSPGRTPPRRCGPACSHSGRGRIGCSWGTGSRPPPPTRPSAATRCCCVGARSRRTSTRRAPRPFAASTRAPPPASPRTAAWLLVTVDGRQPGHSAGATLRQTAELLRALGAVDALNLDGGGSTTMVVRGADDVLRVANRPSDAAGERPVANALAVVGCPGR